jgi:peptide/nickel transport system permease protein
MTQQTAHTVHRNHWLVRLEHSPLLRNPLYLGAMLVAALLILGTVFAPLLAPYDPNALNLNESFAPISRAHWLGADQQGRDILSRLLWGGQSTLFGALMVAVFSTLIGVPLGLISGYSGGRVDSVIMRFLDVLLAFPTLLLALVAIAVLGRSWLNVIVTLSIVYSPVLARVIRSVVLIERETQYIEAARALGASHGRIIGRHLFVNVTSPILVQSLLTLAYAMLDLASLGFLGFGVQPPTADWGTMLSEGQSQLLLSPNTAIAAGVTVLLAVVSFNLIGDGLSALLDPKRRGKG